MLKNTRLNRRIAVFGAYGIMKSSAVIRKVLFQALKRGESVDLDSSRSLDTKHLPTDCQMLTRNTIFNLRKSGLKNFVRKNTEKYKEYSDFCRKM